MRFTVRAWQCNVAQKRRKRELKMSLKVPQTFKHTCCRDSCPLNAAFFNMETRFVFGKDNVVKTRGEGNGFGPVLLVVRKTRTFFLVKPNIPES